MITSFFGKRTKILCKKFISLFLIVLPSLLFGQVKPPTGKEIASIAKKYRELKQYKKTDVLNTKKMSFTPVELIDSAKVGSGFLLGVLENEIPGGETGLPPGRYNLYFHEINGKPQVYAEANGVIVKQASRVSVDKSKDQNDKKPKITFMPGDGYKTTFVQFGWYLYYYYGGSGYASTTATTTTTTTYGPCGYCIYRVYF